MARVEISKKLVLLNSASTLASKMVNLCVIVWMHQYLVRRIAPEEYSLLPLVGSIMLFLPLLTTVLQGGLGQFIVEAYARDDEERITLITSTMFPFMLGTACLLAVVGSLFAWRIDYFLEIDPRYLWDARIVFGLSILSAAVRLAVAPFSVGIFVRQRFVLANIVGTGFEFGRIGLLCFLLIGLGPRVVWVIVAAEAVDLIRLGVFQIISKRLVPALKFRFGLVNWSVFREITAFGGWKLAVNIAGMIRNGADPILLNKFASATDLTAYHLGSMVFNQVRMMSGALSVSLQPQLIAMHSTGMKDRLTNAYLRGGRLALWASLVLVAPLIIFNQEIMLLYAGATYSSAALVMVLLLTVYPITYGNFMMYKMAPAMRAIKGWAVRAIISHTSNLLLTILFVRFMQLGAVGSALGTFVAIAFFTPVTMLPFGLKLANASFNRWLNETAFPGFLPACTASAVLLLLRFYIRPESWLSLGFCVLVGLMVYGLVLFGFSLQKQDRQDVTATVEMIRNYLKSGA